MEKALRPPCEIAALGLHSAVYNPDPEAFDHALHKIVDSDGHDAGFASYIFGMLREIEGSAAQKTTLRTAQNTENILNHLI